MKIRHSFKIALDGLRANKPRSALTTLGIIIGITAIILIMSVGQGAEKLILNEISGIGAETIVIRPGREPQGPTDFAETLFADSLKDREVEALRKKSNVPGLVAVEPAVFVPGSVAYGSETYKATVLGWSAELMMEMFKVYPTEGTIFTSGQIRDKASVTVIGAKVKQELFGPSDAVGQNIKIKGRNFRVVGVFGSKGQVALFNVDEMVVIPPTTAQTYLLGINHYHEIITRAESPEAVARTVYDIERTLRELHNISDPAKDDFFVATQQGVAEQVRTIIQVLTVFLSFVVAVALVVGGIGVMNIMLVTVTERTREIGLRKAVGATDSDILTQFLFESMMLTVVGGLIGIALGVLFSLLAAVVLTSVYGFAWSFVFPLAAFFLGVGVSAFVGVAFGLYPARQAARKNPIEALRYE